jgi:hypothetical protein
VVTGSRFVVGCWAERVRRALVLVLGLARVGWRFRGCWRLVDALVVGGTLRGWAQSGGTLRSGAEVVCFCTLRSGTRAGVAVGCLV